ncbi:hypothetical protein PAXRUDRAFT_830208 [Paxillus rubicundulus Ve08.2h10]|uniref:Uncharacterized protein n=1 Tax=Paxillus rubicundulus Ve08.2h10 TaxID=930991 RepID=A0A0D0DLI5_9AGAM|nr:hypothetical protein PAXRUDRAFT_830208 [Paxillus rubicundulus Ve08.2h10]
MTAWAQSIRHPWFKPPAANAMKRRLSTTEDNHDQQSSEFPNGRQKRSKHSTLEHGFAHMTLNNLLPLQTPPGQPLTNTCSAATMSAQVHPPSAHRPYTSEACHVILPGSVEEPALPAPQTDMEIEPDPTDMHWTTGPSHENDDRKDPTSRRLQIKEVQISSVILEQLKKQTKSPPPLIPISPPASQALVLFRPLRPPSPKSIILGGVLSGDEGQESARAANALMLEDDAMDVE